MGCLYDWLKNGLAGEVSSRSMRNECLSITRWPQAFSWISLWVRMWSIDLEDLTGNRADTQDDTYTRQVIRISPSGKVAVTALEFYNIKILDANTGKVVARTDVEYEDGMSIAFPPNDSQVAFLSEYLITIWDTIHLEKHVSFKPWPRKDARRMGRRLPNM